MDIFESIDFKSHIEDLMREWHVPGLSMSVFDANSIKTHACGLADLKSERPVTSDTMFDCASTSKSLTAAALGKLVESNEHIQVSWNTSVSKLLPDDFVLPSTVATELTTIEDILCHRSGMGRHDFSYLGVRSQNPDSTQSIVRNLRNLPMIAESRAKFEYNNMMYTVAAYLVEKISGQSFIDFLKSRFFDVLQMKSTFLQSSTVFAAGQGDNLARPYVWRKAKEAYEELGLFDQPEGIGAGIIQSTSPDYARWVQAAMTQNEAVLSKETYEELTKPRIISEVDDDLKPFTSYSLYAFGWEVEFYRGYKVVRHEGGECGYASLILFVPEFQFGLVIFGNSADTSEVAHILSMELIDSLLKIPTEDRINWRERTRQMEEKSETKKKDDLRGLRKSLCTPESTMGVDPNRPLVLYTGKYNNAGYHDITIDVQSNSLHIDGTDRCMGFHMTFQHVCDDTKFIAVLTDDADFVCNYKAEFRFDDEWDEHGAVGAKVATAVGIDFSDHEGSEYIWFHRVSDTVT